MASGDPSPQEQDYHVANPTPPSTHNEVSPSNEPNCDAGSGSSTESKREALLRKFGLTSAITTSREGSHHLREAPSQSSTNTVSAQPRFREIFNTHHENTSIGSVLESEQTPVSKHGRDSFDLFEKAPASLPHHSIANRWCFNPLSMISEERTSGSRTSRGRTSGESRPPSPPSNKGEPTTTVQPSSSLSTDTIDMSKADPCPMCRRSATPWLVKHIFINPLKKLRERRDRSDAESGSVSPTTSRHTSSDKTCHLRGGSGTLLLLGPIESLTGTIATMTARAAASVLNKRRTHSPREGWTG